MINITNNVILLGRLTKDPEIKTGKNGKTYTKFTVAVNTRCKKEDKKATFVPLVAFGKVSDFINKYVHAGERVYIGASIENNDYEVTKNDEKFNVYSFSFVVQQIEFADGRPIKTKAAEDDFMLPDAEDAFAMPKEEETSVAEEKSQAAEKAEDKTQHNKKKASKKAEEGKKAAAIDDGFIESPFEMGEFF